MKAPGVRCLERTDRGSPLTVNITMLVLTLIAIQIYYNYMITKKWKKRREGGRIRRRDFYAMEPNTKPYKKQISKHKLGLG